MAARLSKISKTCKPFSSLPAISLKS
jgi:hypothetical protein